MYKYRLEWALYTLIQIWDYWQVFGNNLKIGITFICIIIIVTYVSEQKTTAHVDDVLM